MIIILGPDHSGKTTLAKRLGLPYYHFDKDSNYLDYLKPLAELKLINAVLDRHAICEYPYVKVMGRQFKFTMKEWHNLLLLTLIQNPLIILSTHKPLPFQYPKEQYMPYDKWDECLALYREFLSTHHIPFMEHDYNMAPPVELYLRLEEKFRHQMSWWEEMWRLGYGCIGSPNPKVLLVAERIGPNNVNNLPFETGPTGRMLTDMLAATGTPLNKFTVTNMVKSYRRDPRMPNENDQALLHNELVSLRPEKVVFMGSVARRGARVTKGLGIPYDNIVHLGALNYAGVTDMSGYHAGWRRIMNMVPTLTLGRARGDNS